MAGKYLLVDKKEQVAFVVIDRPRKMNALTDDLISEFNHQLGRLAADDTIRTVIVRGAGDKAFCSGYDMSALAANRDRTAETQDRFEHPLEPVAKSIADYPYPVIAMVNGDAFGAGCELAVCCDIRVAADDIRMGVPPAKLGVVYPWTGLRRFIQAIGWNHTREMLFSGDVIKGPRLKTMGLVNHLVPRDSLETFTVAMAERIAANAPLSLKGIKKTLSLLAGNTITMPAEDMAEARSAMLQALRSEDLIEGQRAFKEKRKPRFTGR